jgi:hypothetical protein
MADLARIKRNVAKMASMNAPEEDIDGYIASEGVTIDDVRNYRELQPMTEEQKMQAQEMAKQMRPEKTLGDKVSEFLVTNPIARQVGFGLQGISNASLNPAGYVARAAGIDTKPLEAQTAGERATELAGQYGFDAATLVPTLGLVAEAAPAVAPYVAPLVEGGVPLALTGSTGSALATGIINPENSYARMATDILGGGLGAGLTRPKFTAPKQDVKTVKELTKSIGEDALNRDIVEAERTGRNLLEVGGDEVMQAAQQARQQSPEARKIITDTLESSIAEQPTRTRGIINEALGTKGKNATIAQVMENAKAEAQPIYKELDDIGDLAKYEIENESRKNIGFDDTVRDVNGDELFKNLTLYADNKPVGYIDYSVYDDKPYIEMIKVLDGEKRKGYGTELIKQLQRQYPDNEIDFGMMTDEGSALYKSLQKNIKTNPEYAKYEKKLANSNKKLKEYSDILDRVTGEETGKEQDKIIKAADAWQKEHWKNEDYKDWLENNWKQKTFIDTNPKEVESQLARVIKDNPFIQSEIANVRKDLSLPKNVRESSDTSFSILNAVKKNIDDRINVAKRSGENELAARLTGIKNELKNKINDATGGKYSKALGIYEDAFRFRDASDLGRDVFNSRKSPDELKTAWNSLSSTEKQAAKIGLREEVMNKIGSATNETNALNRFLPENVREKITTIAGNKEGGRIIDEAEQAVKLRRNYNKLTSGSQTAEKQSLRDTLRGIRGFIRNPWETTVDALAKPFDTQRNIRMAEYLTENPASLKDAFNRVNMANRLNAERMPKRTPYLQSALRAIIEEK